ncbi:hypothetical protein [Natronobeatus ordinarius]|uniref:hypothetical protein n=1 Tax=Natronobeatus ordinarius TaxID=2963433 RepID=UPI0020CBBAB3|nr:hypothetical protein [Natronobeatus ordinarius]
MPIETVACPACDEPVAISLPRGYVGLEVSAEPDPTKPEDERHHTRHVRCSAGHVVYFYFERTYRGPGG